MAPAPGGNLEEEDEEELAEVQTRIKKLMSNLEKKSEYILEMTNEKPSRAMYDLLVERKEEFEDKYMEFTIVNAKWKTDSKDQGKMPYISQANENVNEMVAVQMNTRVADRAARDMLVRLTILERREEKEQWSRDRDQYDQGREDAKRNLAEPVLFNTSMVRTQVSNPASAANTIPLNNPQVQLGGIAQGHLGGVAQGHLGGGPDPDFTRTQAFHATLPLPWNECPPADDAKPGEFTKLMEKAPKFDGKQRSYPTFRASFLAYVHLKRLNPKYKVGALKNCLDITVGELRVFAEGMILTELGYKEAIIHLESMYGGEEALVDLRIKDIRDMSHVRFNNSKSLGLTIAKLKSWRAAFAGIGATADFNAIYVYNDLSPKFPTSYIEKYEAFKIAHGLTRSSTDSLIAWCDEYLPQVKNIEKSRGFDVDGDKQFSKKDGIGTNAEATRKPYFKKDRYQFTGMLGGDEEHMKEADSWEDEDSDDGAGLDVYYTQRKRECPSCKGEHFLDYCEQFASSAFKPEERRVFLATNKRCYACFRPGHNLTGCRWKKECKIDGCTRPHHKLLHGSKIEHTTQNFMVHGSQTRDREEEQDIYFGTTDYNQPQKPYLSPKSLRIVPVKLSLTRDSEPEIVNMLLDEGASTSILSERIAKKLQIRGYPAEIAVGVLSGHKVKIQAVYAEVFVSNTTSRNPTRISVEVINNPTGELTAVDWNKRKAEWKHIQHIEFPQALDYDKVDIILGSDHPDLLESSAAVTGDKDEPVARKGRFGWNVGGPIFPSRRGKKNNEDRPQFSGSHYVLNFTTDVAALREERQGGENRALCTSIFYGKETLPSNCLTMNAKQFKQNDVVVLYGNTDKQASIGRVIENTTSESEVVAVKTQDDILERQSTSIGLLVRDEQQMLGGESSSYQIVERNEEGLENLLRKHIEIEQLPEDDDLSLSKDEEYAYELMKSSKRKLSSGHIEIGCLWKEGEPNFPKSFRPVLARLESLLKSKWFKEPGNWEKYNAKLMDHVEKGYATILPEGSENDENARYMPHFPVLREEKTKTKIRPVMDGAAKVGGKALNDAILVGPTMMNCLPVVLLRSRRNAIQVMGDIKEMFLQVKLPEKDKKYHRFLWKTPEGKLLILQYNCHVFGNKGSPNVSIFTVKDSAAEKSTEFPKAAEAVIESSIVDDINDSARTLAEALEMIKGLLAIFENCGMKITQWVSNNQEIMETFPEAERATSINLTAITTPHDDNMPKIKCLGIIWLSKEDNYTFSLNIPEVKVWTRREILSTYSRLYDPLGLICPVAIASRIIFQGLWREEYGWDTPLPPEILAKWEKWLEELNLLPDYRIPRCLRRVSEEEETAVQLLVFGDASKTGYAACAYLKVTYTDGSCSINLAMARAKVAPLKYRSIPRLELEAAVLATDLARQINKAFKLAAENIYFFTDSCNVLWWLHNATHKPLLIYVAARVNKILLRTSVKNWGYVNTLDNPADIPSKGMSAADLKNCSLWWHGPEFAKLQENLWPITPSFNDPEEALVEVRKEKIPFPDCILRKEENEIAGRNSVENTGEDISFNFANANVDRADVFEIAAIPPTFVSDEFPNLDIENDRSHASHFSDLKRMRSVWALCLRFFGKKKKEAETLRARPNGRSKFCKFDKEISDVIHRPTEEELRLVDERIMQKMQAESFSKAIEELSNRDELFPNNPLARVRARLDTRGILRLASRLRFAEHLEEGMRCPILLHKKHALTKLITREVHEKVLKHVGGSGTTNAELNKRYHVFQGKGAIKSIVAKCITCKRINAKPSGQIMAPLPDFRVGNIHQRWEAFSRTAMDVAGPFFVVRGRKTVKRWLLLFCCAFYRAVHLEVLNSMDASAFLLAFERFIARRPRPNLIICDNGTNFKRGSEDLKKVFRDLETRTDLLEKYPGITWRFNAPLGSHQGGLFERLIGIVKKSLFTAAPSKFQEDEFATYLCVSEALVNSRPLSYINGDGNDAEILTPGHFLHGNAYKTLAPMGEGENWSVSKRWFHINKVMDHFWKRFINECIPLLHIFNKWHRASTNIKEGDIVVLFEPDQKERGSWPIARVQKVEKGRDGHVRTLHVKFRGKILRRPLNRTMFLLPEGDVLDVEEDEAV